MSNSLDLAGYLAGCCLQHLGRVLDLLFCC